MSGRCGGIENHNISLGKIEAELRGEAKRVESVKLPLQTTRGGAEQYKVISIEQAGYCQSSEGRGCGVRGLNQRRDPVNVKAKKEGAQGASLLDANVAWEGTGETSGALGSGSDMCVQGLKG